jgi:hypothetical protein
LDNNPGRYSQNFLRLSYDHFHDRGFLTVKVSLKMAVNVLVILHLNPNNDLKKFVRSFANTEAGEQ